MYVKQFENKNISINSELTKTFCDSKSINSQLILAMNCTTKTIWNVFPGTIPTGDILGIPV